MFLIILQLYNMKEISNFVEKIISNIFFYIIKRTNMTPNFKEGTYTDRIPILTFHRLVPEDIKNTKKYINKQYIGSIEKFAEMMEWLYSNDYKTINTTEFYLWYKGKIEYNRKTVLITIDDGFYDEYYLAYPIIKKYNFKITSFIVGSRIKKKTPKYNKNKIGFIGQDIIDKIKKEYPNIEFQSHSYNMHYRTKNNQIRIKRMDFEELKLDVLSNSKFGFTTMAYPYGKYNINIKSILKEQRYL